MMLTSSAQRRLMICWAALLFAGLGAGPASAGSCGTPNFNFELGLSNTCNSNTSLSGGAMSTLDVRSTLAGATALTGWATASAGTGTGVFGRVESTGMNSYGVYGLLTSNTPGAASAAVYGESDSTTGDGAGVWGVHLLGTGSAPGVLGQTKSSGTDAAGVRGISRATNGSGYGVWGSHDGSGTAVFGTSVSGIGVLGASTSAGVYGFGSYGVIGVGAGGGLAGYFSGNVNVTGTLTKGAGAFRIDHPLDPAHKYLQHSFVESPDMMDVYNGNVTTNGKGFATVKLPAYFQALNKDFRYQLTPIGHNAWGARAVVWDEIRANRFTIRSEPNVKISWQVTGVRHDAYANAHRIQTVIEKPTKEQGKYLHPELYGKPTSLSVVPRVAAKALAQARP